MSQQVKCGLWETAIGPRYDYAEPFKDGVALVETRHRCSFINKQGKVVIKHSAKRDLDSESSCNRILVHTEKGAGYLDSSGKLVIPIKYNKAEPFSNNRAIIGDEHLYGIINEKGEQVLEPVYDYINCFESGLASFRKDGLFGFLDLEGNIKIEPQYISVSNFINGYAKALKPNRKTGGYINRNGDELFNFRRFDYIGEFSEGLAPVQIKSLFGYVDTNGEIVIEPLYLKALDFKGGAAPVQVENNRYLFINTQGKTIVDNDFSEARPFSEGLAAVRHFYKWGLINTLGDFVVTPELAGVGDCSEGYVVAMWYTGVGYIKVVQG